MSKYILERYTQYLCVKNPSYMQKTIKPTGLLIHSTGANNPKLSRYCNETNGWNRETATNSVHGVIGKDEKGNIDFVQLLPFNCKSWGCGKGSKGSYNASHIQVEICEDGLKDAEYFNAVYEKAVEVFADLAVTYDIDVKNVTCHSEAHAKGYASNHADVMHWFPKYGKSMDTFRTDIKSRMKELTKQVSTAENVDKKETEKETSKEKKRSKKEVVKAIQKALNKDYDTKLSVDGIAGTKTYAAIKSHNLKKGSKGSFVKELQTTLNELINAGLKVDGVFGSATLTSVKKFQKKYKLTTDGIVGSGTIKKIIELY